jgi:hypothetical protein
MWRSICTGLDQIYSLIGLSRKGGNDEDAMQTPRGEICIKVQSRKGSCMMKVLKLRLGGRNW